VKWWLRAGIGLFGFALLVGCGNASAPSSFRTSSAVDAATPVVRGARILNAKLSWDSSVPPNPGGPIMQVSGAVVSVSGAVVNVGEIRAYVLDGPPGRAHDAVTTIEVHEGTFAKVFEVIGPGGHEIRLDYVEGGKVLASTVVKG